VTPETSEIQQDTPSMEHGRLPSPAAAPPLADTKSTEEERNKIEIREKKARTEIAEIVPETEDLSLHV